MINIDEITDAIVSHALSTGYFDEVNAHEPLNAPGNGLACAVWIADIRPVQLASGLQSTSARLEFKVRIYTSADTEPYDNIDSNLTKALDSLMFDYSDDFDLDGTVRNVDLFGAHGDQLRATAGYIKQDSKSFRIFTITLPLILNDVWTQGGAQ